MLFAYKPSLIFTTTVKQVIIIPQFSHEIKKPSPGPIHNQWWNQDLTLGSLNPLIAQLIITYTVLQYEKSRKWERSKVKVLGVVGSN